MSRVQKVKTMNLGYRFFSIGYNGIGLGEEAETKS
jgi:hypothetical protein